MEIFNLGVGKKLEADLGIYSLEQLLDTVMKRAPIEFSCILRNHIRYCFYFICNFKTNPFSILGIIIH